MARIVSVMAGLACALAMCFAVPIASAAPTDHLIFDSGPGFELVATPVSFEVAAVADHVELAMPMLAAASEEGDPVNCSTGPAWGMIPLPLGSYSVERLPACSTDRRHDPGWLPS